MDLSTFLIAIVGALAAGLTGFMWLRVRRKVWTDEHPVMQVDRANRAPDRIAFPG